MVLQPLRQTYFDELMEGDRAKVQALFNRLAQIGRIENREKFKQLGNRAGVNAGLWEFKSHQIRFLGDFRPGAVFVVAHGLRKKQDKLPSSDIERAARILNEHDTRVAIQK